MTRFTGIAAINLLLTHGAALAQPAARSMIEITQATESALVLIDEGPVLGDRRLGFVAGSTDAVAAALSEVDRTGELPAFRGVSGPSTGLIAFVVPVAGHIGFQLTDLLEAGVEGGGIVMWVTLGGYAGAYVKLAPIPFGIAKRVYVGGKFMRAFILGVDEEGVVDMGNATELSLGYRHLTPQNRASGRYWFAELGKLTLLAGEDQSTFAIRVGINNILGRSRY